MILWFYDSMNLWFNDFKGRQDISQRGPFRHPPPFSRPKKWSKKQSLPKPLLAALWSPETLQNAPKTLSRGGPGGVFFWFFPFSAEVCFDQQAAGFYHSLEVPSVTFAVPEASKTHLKSSWVAGAFSGHVCLHFFWKMLQNDLQKNYRFRRLSVPKSHKNQKNQELGPGGGPRRSQGCPGPQNGAKRYPKWPQHAPKSIPRGGFRGPGEY